MAQRRGLPRRAVGRPAKEATGETETQILDAAEQVFARVGFYGATTQAIAEECGVTKAMIHYCFDSKERLYHAVLDRILFELIKLVQEASAQRLSRAERLDHFMRGFFGYVARHPNFGRLTYMGSGDQSGYFDGIVTTFFRPLLDRGVRFIEGGIAEGEFRAVDARQVLLAIYSTAMGYFADAPFISLILENEALKSAQQRPQGGPAGHGLSGTRGPRAVGTPKELTNRSYRRASTGGESLPSHGGLLENYPHG